MEKRKRRRRKPKFRWADVIAELRSKPTCSIPLAGLVLGELSKNAAYEAAAAGMLGVPIMEVGGKKKRVPSIAVLRKIGLEEDPSA
jgi:hypothetical protein